MSVASHGIRDGRRSLYRWAGVMALVLVAACGEQRESAGADADGAGVTDTAPASSADTTTTPAGDTTAPTAPDTAASDTATAVGTRDTAAKQPSRQPSTAAAPAKPPAPTRPETAAKPAEPKAQPEEPAGDTSAAQPATSVTARADTGTAQPETATGQTETATGQTETAVAPLRDEYHRAPKDTVDQTTYDGWKQYNLNCARCHGEDVLGSTIAPHLIMSLKPNGPINTQEAFTEVVCAGRPAKGMPSWCALGMEPAKINQIYSYVKGRSDGKIGPGRPAVKSGG